MDQESESLLSVLQSVLEPINVPPSRFTDSEERHEPIEPLDSTDVSELTTTNLLEHVVDSYIKISPKLLYDQKTSHIGRYYVSSEKLVSEPSAEHLKPFIEVAGNAYRNYFFIGIRFKNPVIVFKQHCLNTLEIPPGTCLLVDASIETLKLKFSESVYLVTYKCDDEFQKTPTEAKLLEWLFPPFNSFYCKSFYRSTLYAITSTNPFKSIWTRNRKNFAYNSLARFFDYCERRLEFFSFELATLYRHFTPFKHDLNRFQSWFPLAVDMIAKGFRITFHRNPTVDFATRLYQILKRSKAHVIPKDHPPKEFYQCQLTLDDSVSVGVACRIANHKAEYVSAMILCFTNEYFIDTNQTSCCFNEHMINSATCKHWLQLYKDRETWEKSGLLFYLRGTEDHVCNLTLVIDWLSIQTAEPYRHMKKDLMQVYYILKGEVKPRWC